MRLLRASVVGHKTFATRAKRRLDRDRE